MTATAPTHHVVPESWLPHDLPAPSAGAALVIRASNDPAFSLADVARIIEREPSLTVNLLRLANSAAYGNGREIKSVGQATVLLGARTIRNLAVAHVVMSMRTRFDTGGLDVKLFWEDSLRRACAALVLARTAGYEDPSEAFTVGLVQDLGVLVIAATKPTYGLRLHSMRGAPGSERIKTDVELVGHNHAELFVRLARAWQLPQDLVEAVATHHQEGRVSGPRRTTRLAMLARAADVVADVAQTHAVGDTLSRARALLTQIESRQALKLDTIIDEVSVEMASQSTGLDIHVGAQPSFDSLVHSANQALVQISYSYEELTQRLETLLREKDELAKKLAASNAALHRLATTDPLTNVANRRSFADAMERVLEEAVREGTEVSLVMLDLDRFKVINDTYGHQAGDDVLVAVADRILKRVRPEDLVGRLGGEEFAVLLPRCGAVHGPSVAERLRVALESEPVRCRDGSLLAVTASFGGVTMSGHTHMDDAIKAADEAMYASKEAGRNCVSWIDPD